MRRIIASLVLAVLAATPAFASEFEDMDICLGRAVIARAICKDPLDVNFVTKVKDNIYLFSVFYARQEARFVVGVTDKMIRVQGKEFLKLTKSLPYHFDKDSKCAVVEFSIPDCPVSEPIVCCSEKTTEEKLDDKFWGRSIPDLLDEDLKKAFEEYEQEQEQGADQEPGAETQGEQPAAQ
ncbi:MAG: hypothetical protein H0S80_14775 [Desulfovibrionaceae bacterium]|nr:hypothetical protein [Desulfovibrionaceae bacterium]